MLLKYFYDNALAHASYLVGCQRTGEAIIVDPGRDIEQYLDAAKKEDLKIVGVAETHIHADYVSGARELAERIDAKLYVSDAGPSEWKYEYAKPYRHQLLKDGDRFTIGNLDFETMFTPGHTPEHICFVLTDRGGGANRPMGIFTGDFVFVGSIGRPDLLEQAAGVMGSADIGARQLYHSTERFKKLPDYLQIWPAHGAGSPCGKGLGAIPSSTVGYEKMFNPALQFNDEQAFVDYILAEQPEAPSYFALMKRDNKIGPPVLGSDQLPPQLPVDRLREMIGQEQLIDNRDAARFAAGHVSGSLSLPVKYTANFGGWLVDYNRPVYLIADANTVKETVRVLRKIGVVNIAGFFLAEQVEKQGLNSVSFPEKSPQELAVGIESGDLELIDVRGLTEFQEEHIPGAQHYFLGRFNKTASQINLDKPIVVVCRTGGRSAVAASVLQKMGVKQTVINLAGGIEAWKRAGLNVEKPTGIQPTVCCPT